jgi:hypothetical protein
MVLARDWVHGVEARWEPSSQEDTAGTIRPEATGDCSGIRRRSFCWIGCPPIRPSTVMGIAIHWANSANVLLQHDNARPRGSRQTIATLGALGYTVLPHPPYSPDLAPSDYALFDAMKDVHLQRRASGSCPAVGPGYPQRMVCCPNKETAGTMAKLHRHWRGITLT